MVQVRAGWPERLGREIFEVVRVFNRSNQSSRPVIFNEKEYVKKFI